MVAAHWLSPVELRWDGRALVGTALPYEAVATRPGFTERWRSGSAILADNVVLNLRHNAGRLVAQVSDGTLEIRNTSEGVHIVAQPADSAVWSEALADIERGALRGLSVEFRALADVWHGSEREIERGLVSGIGIVERPAYDTKLEVRQDADRIRIWL